MNKTVIVSILMLISSCSNFHKENYSNKRSQEKGKFTTCATLSMAVVNAYYAIKNIKSYNKFKKIEQEHDRELTPEESYDAYLNDLNEGNFHYKERFYNFKFNFFYLVLKDNEDHEDIQALNTMIFNIAMADSSSGKYTLDIKDSFITFMEENQEHLIEFNRQHNIFGEGYDYDQYLKKLQKANLKNDEVLKKYKEDALKLLFMADGFQNYRYKEIVKYIALLHYNNKSDRDALKNYAINFVKENRDSIIELYRRAQNQQEQ